MTCTHGLRDVQQEKEGTINRNSEAKERYRIQDAGCRMQDVGRLLGGVRIKRSFFIHAEDFFYRAPFIQHSFFFRKCFYRGGL